MNSLSKAFWKLCPHSTGLLGLLSVAGCAQTPLEFKVDPSFSDEAAEGIAQAARDWNAITNAEHKIGFRGNEWYISKEQPPHGWNGVTYPSEQLIKLAPKPVGVSWRVLAKHEFGHALGLRHLCVGGQGKSATPRPCEGASLGVMDPLNSSEDFSAADIEECRAAGACD